MRLPDGVKIVSIASAAHDEEAEVAHPEDDGSADEGAVDGNEEVTEEITEAPTEE